VNALLCFRRIENELRLAAFLRDRVIALDGHLPEGIAIRRHAIAERDVIDRVDGGEGCDCGRECDDQRTP